MVGAVRAPAGFARPYGSRAMSTPAAQPEAPEHRPAILAVDDEPAVLAAVARDLRRGFGERYRVLRATSGAEREETAALVALQQEAVAHGATCTTLDALDATDDEDALLERLEQLGIEEPWRIAEPLSAAHIDQAWLDEVAAHAGPATSAALRWVAATLTAGRLAVELRDSTERISRLVGAVKSHAAMDRGGATAIDALGERGTITVTTRRDGSLSVQSQPGRTTFVVRLPLP